MLLLQCSPNATNTIHYLHRKSEALSVWNLNGSPHCPCIYTLIHIAIIVCKLRLKYISDQSRVHHFCCDLRPQRHSVDLHVCTVRNLFLEPMMSRPACAVPSQHAERNATAVWPDTLSCIPTASIALAIQRALYHVSGQLRVKAGVSLPASKEQYVQNQLNQEVIQKPKLRTRNDPGRGTGGAWGNVSWLYLSIAPHFS